MHAFRTDTFIKGKNSVLKWSVRMLRNIHFQHVSQSNFALCGTSHTQLHEILKLNLITLLSPGARLAGEGG